VSASTNGLYFAAQGFVHFVFPLRRISQKVLTMNKTEITKSLREYAGGDYISKRKLRQYLQCSDAHRDEIIQDLDFVPRGRRILYFVPDVADRINRQAVHQNRIY